MCPVGQGKLMRSKGFMDFSLFKEILWGELKNTDVKGIRFVRWGEPTMHPRFTDFLRETKKAKFLVHFNTNGMLFDEELVWAILAYKVDSIKFSFQGLDKYGYESVRRGGNFDTIKQWIKYLYEKRGNGQRPYITVDTTVTQGDDAGCASFREGFRDISDDINIRETVTFVGDGFTRTRRNNTCSEYNKVSLNWDGTVSFCCSDFDNLLLVGNLRKQSLSEVWNGEQAVTYRRMLIEKKHKLLPLCKYCLDG